MKKALVVLAIGTVLPLFAHASTNRFGINLSTLTPVGIQHGFLKQGIGGSLFFSHKISEGQSIIARVETDIVPSSRLNFADMIANLSSRDRAAFENEFDGDEIPSSLSMKCKVSTIALGIDYKVQLKQSGGLYGLVGVDSQRRKISLSVHDREEDDSAKDSVKGKNTIGYTVGIGRDFDNNLGMQVRYNTYRSGSTSLSTVKLGLTYTF